MQKVLAEKIQYLWNEHRKKCAGSIISTILAATLLALYSPLSYQPVVQAVPVSWTGNGDGSTWSNAANWSSGSVPDSNSDVTIDATVTVNITAATTINSLTLGGSANPVLNFQFDGILSSTPLVIDEGNLTVNSGATIQHSDGASSLVGTIYIDVQSGTATITGNINASEKGFSGGDAGQDGNGLSPGENETGGNGGGGGYGGAGGNGKSTNSLGGSTTGNSVAPTASGSGGGGGTGSGARGGDAGGIIRLNIKGNTTISGTLSSDGEDAPAFGSSPVRHCGGGGSGGSIFITTEGTLTLNSSAILSATGGNGGACMFGLSSGGGGGGGGRIAYRYVNITQNGTLAVTAGTAGNGGAGGAGNAGSDGTTYAYQYAVPDQPSIQTPISGATSIERTQTITSSTYSNDLTHTSSDWELSTASNDFTGTNLVAYAYNDTTNKTQIAINSTNFTFQNSLAGRTDLKPFTTYYIRVRYKNSAGNATYSSGTHSFTTKLNTVPATPTLTDPTDPTNRTLTIQANAFSDTDSDSHAMSDWQIAADSGFNSMVATSMENTLSLTSVSVNGTNFTFLNALAGQSSLAANTTYYARVRYRDDENGSSSYSETISFTTGTNVSPNKPSISSPSSDAINIAVNPQITSSSFSDPDDSIHSASSWQIYDAQNISAASLVWTVTHDPTNLTLITVNSSTGTFQNSLSGRTKLLPGITYYVRVIHADPASADSEPSDTKNFNTIQAPGNPTLSSSSHPSEQETSTNATPNFTTSSASPAPDHYHYLVNQTAVPTKLEVENGTSDSDGIFTVATGIINSSDTWYVHIVSHDSSHNPSLSFDTYRIYYVTPQSIVTGIPGGSSLTENTNENNQESKKTSLIEKIKNLQEKIAEKTQKNEKEQTENKNSETQDSGKRKIIIDQLSDKEVNAYVKKREDLEKAKNTSEILKTAGINTEKIKNKNDDEFVSRCEMAEILAKAFFVGEIKKPEKKPFKDVPIFSPCAPAVNALKEAGIVKGYPDGSFQKDKDITRAEGYKIIFETIRYFFNLKEEDLDSLVKKNSTQKVAITDESLLKNNGAKNEIDNLDKNAWFTKYFIFAKKNDLIPETFDDSVKPNEKMEITEMENLIANSIEFFQTALDGENIEKQGENPATTDKEKIETSKSKISTTTTKTEKTENTKADKKSTLITKTLDCKNIEPVDLENAKKILKTTQNTKIKKITFIYDTLENIAQKLTTQFALPIQIDPEIKNERVSLKINEATAKRTLDVITEKLPSASWGIVKNTLFIGKKDVFKDFAKVIPGKELACPWTEIAKPYAPFCGNGIELEQQEECDDGNSIDNDGCSKECKIEIFKPTNNENTDETNNDGEDNDTSTETNNDTNNDTGDNNDSGNDNNAGNKNGDNSSNENSNDGDNETGNDENSNNENSNEGDNDTGNDENLNNDSGNVDANTDNSNNISSEQKNETEETLSLKNNTSPLTENDQIEGTTESEKTVDNEKNNETAEQPLTESSETAIESPETAQNQTIDENISAENTVSSFGGGSSSLESSNISLETISKAITSQDNQNKTTNDQTENTENSDKDADQDGLSDGIENMIGTDEKKNDTDNDGIQDAEEFLIFNTNPLDAESQIVLSPETEIIPRITNLGENDIFTDSNPLIQGFGKPNSEITFIIMNETGEKFEYQLKIGPDGKFLTELPNLLDGKYSIRIGENTTKNFSIRTDIKIAPPEIISLEGQLMDKNTIILTSRRKPSIRGHADLQSIVIANWKSAVFASALINDSLDGTFTVTSPQNLETGSHTAWLYSIRPTDNVRSPEIQVQFNIIEPIEEKKKINIFITITSIMFLSYILSYTGIKFFKHNHKKHHHKKNSSGILE
ncbi:S-layer homology domain-containing protein [Candidatus Peregrinibacteria bacterium]|nr:S-layer homology domain-containing protein [Candidatus Peregrinibacteria bacterium]